MAVVLIMFLGFQFQNLIAEQENPLVQYDLAKQAYAAGNYGESKALLGALIPMLDESQEANRTALARFHLLLGASEEKLGNGEAARAAYLKAKELLGSASAESEGVSFAGLILYGEIFGAAPEAKEMDPLMDQFLTAKASYFTENYEQAKQQFEKLVSDLESVSGRDSLKGETDLLLGATYEKLEFRQLAEKYYCLAKRILGESKTVEGLDLKSLKWYRVDCPVVAAAVGRKKGGFGKLFGVILGLAVLGGLVWYLFINKNSPIKKKEKGDYTSITVKIDVTYKGANSKGYRRLTLAGDVKHHENYTFTQAANQNSSCDNSQLGKTYSYNVTVNGKSLAVKHEFLNWDYYGFISPGTNYKFLCTQWTVTIVNYQYTSGKEDPGSPTISGTDSLVMVVSRDCVQKTQRLHDCTTNAAITFSAPATGAAKTAQTSATVSDNRLEIYEDR